MNLLWEILKYLGVMSIVILIALTPSVNDNLYYERMRRRRMKRTSKNNAVKFFKGFK